MSAFEEKETVMENYIALVKRQIDEEHAVIVIDNSDITKLCSPMMEAISDVRDGSTGEIKKGYYTVEAAVLSKGKIWTWQNVTKGTTGWILWINMERKQNAKSVSFQ